MVFKRACTLDCYDLCTYIAKCNNNKVESIAKWIELSSGNDSDVKKKAVHLLSRYVKLYRVPKAKWKG